MFINNRKNTGFSFVELMVVAALSTLIFGALFSSVQYSLKLIGDSRAKLSALSLANERMEYFRSLPYDDVGTISGIPAGTIPQNSTTTFNGITFSERVLVEYVDDAADGLNSSDTNGIPADFKRVKVEHTWRIGNSTSSIALVSSITPRSVETTAGGGTVRINVIDDQSMLLPGASVRLINNTTTSTIDVTRITDAAGAALFSGSPAASGYEVIVTANILGNSYSTMKTHKATTSNPSPSTDAFAVLEADISTLTFQIGELSDLDIHTYSAVAEGQFVEDFVDLLSAASSTDVNILGGELVLDDLAGVYYSNGTAFLGPIEPTTLDKWETLRLSATVPPNTFYKAQIFTGTTTGPYTVVPDVDLPNNSIGFFDTINDISMLDSGTYPAIFVGITLNTTNTSFTPSVDELSLYYRESVTNLPAVSFDIHGDKVIGTDLSLAPIYNYSANLTTDGIGLISIADAEFGVYTLAIPGAYDMSSACPAHPFVQQAGVDGELGVVLVANAANTLRLSVADSLGRAIPGASVQLQRAGYNATISTDNCGQAFFTGGVSSNNDYTVNVTATGFAPGSINPLDVSGDTVATVILN